MEKHRWSRAKRFSDTALEALVHGVQRRRNVLYPQGGKRLTIRQRRRVWKEIANSVTAASVVARTPIQCRKRFHDILRLVKAKVAHNQQQAGGDQERVDLTDLEESVFQIIEGAGTESMENGELESSTDDDDDTQEPPATGPEPKEDTYGGEEAQEEDDKMEQRLTVTATSSESGTAQTLEGTTEAGSAHGMERQRLSRATRFSCTALEALVHGVQRRRNILFPQGGKRPSRRESRLVWKEIAKAVTAASVVPRTPLQCRKRFHDLIRLVKGKVADNCGDQQQAEGDQARVGLTDLEQSMFQIIEGAGTESMENGEVESSTDDDEDTQELPTVPEHKEDTYGGGEAQKDKMEQRLTPVDASSESGTAQTLDGSTEAGSSHGMERHRPSRAVRFSDTALEALVDGAQRRRDILFPQDGKRPSKLQCGRVWKEIAKAVTAASVVPRTPLQCRKRLHDLIRLVKIKVADNRGEQQQAGGDQATADLTDQEESMFQINEEAGTESVEDGEAESSTDDDDIQEPPATVPEHKEDTYGGGEAQEDIDRMQQRQTPVDASSKSGIAQTLEGSTEAGSARGESPITSGLQPGQRKRAVRVPGPRRASLRTSSAAQDLDDDLDGPAFTRKVMAMHTEMLDAMASLPRSLLSVSRSIEVSSSNIARGFAQSLEPMISGMEMMGSSMRDLVDPNMMVDVMGDLVASIAAQAEATQRLTAAVEAQTAAIIAGFTSVERGQQSVLQQIAELSEGCRARRGC
uniref:uncharacterized abhydrolase domain-containing protein DDB_G0269086-like n=1 Tax=Pristiophorus japonicus TaxID=55135 RepID=UPI00398F27F5